MLPLLLLLHSDGVEPACCCIINCPSCCCHCCDGYELHTHMDVPGMHTALRLRLLYTHY